MNIKENVNGRQDGTLQILPQSSNSRVLYTTTHWLKSTTRTSYSLTASSALTSWKIHSKWDRCKFSSCEGACRIEEMNYESDKLPHLHSLFSEIWYSLTREWSWTCLSESKKQKIRMRNDKNLTLIRSQTKMCHIQKEGFPEYFHETHQRSFLRDIESMKDVLTKCSEEAATMATRDLRNESRYDH